MPKVSLKRIEINNVIAGVMALLKCKENKQEFNTALIRNKRFLKVEVEEYGERMQKFQEDVNKIITEHCKKDSSGHAITHTIGTGETVQTGYEGLQPGECPAYDSEIKAITDAQKAYRNEVVEVDYYILKKEFLPKTGWGAEMDAVLPITDIKFDDEKEE